MNPPPTTVRVWDLPTRLFHWTLAACVLASIGTAWAGGNAMTWHFRLGYAAFALLAFRLLWGLVGGRWSRFASFAYGPSALLRYLRGRSAPEEHHEVGHSPLGALSVFALLGLLGAQVGSGLFADDEVANTGPLNRFVSNATAHALTGWHRKAGQWLVIALVVLHIGAVLYYQRVRRRDLLRPMLDGDKALPGGVPPAADNARTRLLAAALLVLCAGGVAWLASLGG